MVDNYIDEFLPRHLNYGDESGDQLKHDRHHDNIHKVLNLRAIGALGSTEGFTTTIATQGVAVPVAGPTLLDPRSKRWVSPSEGKLKFDIDNGETVTGSFMATFSLAAAGNNQEVVVEAAVNGVALPLTASTVSISGGGDVRSSVSLGLFQVEKDDEVQLFVANNTSNNDVEFIQYTMLLRT